MDNLLIETLADGDYHSGQTLGMLLGVSRTAVWKHLQKLAGLGIDVESVRGRGYRIPGGLELLDRAAIHDGLQGSVRSLVREVVVLNSVSSTNAYLMERGDGGNRVVCLAEHQTWGRGRRGRTWSSPFGRNIYLSLGWQFDGGAASLEGLSLAVGLAVRRALGGNDQLHLKWPNDLLYDGRKLAGVLLEMQGDPSGQCQVVTGIGINVGMAGQLRPDIDQRWADAQELTRLTRNQIVAAVLNQLVPLLDTFGERGFSPYMDEWNRCDAFRDRAVLLATPGYQVQGIARGVAGSGAVKIEVDGVVSLYNGGELSLRLAQ